MLRSIFKPNTILSAKIIASLPIFIAVNIAAILVWSLDISQQSMPLMLGIIAGGLVDLDNRLTGRLKNIFYTLLAFSISSLTAQYFIEQGFIFTIVMTAMTFCFTMLGAVGLRYSTIAFGTLIVAIYTALAHQPNTLWYVNPLLILAGTLLYNTATLFVYLFFPNRPVQENVAHSFSALADYLDAKSAVFDPDEIEQLENKQINLAMKNSQLIAAFNESRIALFYRIRNQSRHTRNNKLLRYYFSAQEIHERANSSHFNYRLLVDRLKNTDLIFRIQRLLELQAQACRDIAQSLKQNQDYHYNSRLDKAILGINQSFALYNQQHHSNPQELLYIQTLLENLQSVDWQLRNIQQNAPKDRSGQKLYTENITGLSNIWLTIKSQCTFNSQLFRHAIRLAIVVFIGCNLAALSTVERGYWILLTIMFVCQPNYSATKLRLKQRIIGTILGVLVGSLLPYMTSTLAAKLGVVVLSSTFFLFFRRNSFSFSTFFITIHVLATFDIMGLDIYSATLPRLIDTLIGVAISWFAVSYLWPDWKYLQLNKVIHNALQADAKYLLYIVVQLFFSQGDNLNYRIARRVAHEKATELSSTISNMNSEPQKYARHLQQGFELLKLNQSLLSYISGLGAYRNNMKQLRQSADFLVHFYPTAKKIIHLLNHIDQINKDQFELQQLNIELALKQYSDNENVLNTELNVPIQQLSMINQILPNLYQTINSVKSQR
ncbi:MAG: YccS family putative transporter [Pasteurellaceae bacterium]|nr:YccS family putative transporter [Pasteurellaceae bacterium]